MQRFKAALVAAVVFASMVVGIQPAASADSVLCDSGFGTKVPVLMVHGYDSGPDMWTKPGAMADTVRKVSGVHVARPFNYYVDRFEWVTHPNIGPKLAKTIDCLAQASKRSGGRGKVIVIGHSMGGLAARFAANQTVNRRRVADEIGLVITLGTPHLGSSWGNAGTSVATSVCQGAVGTLTMNPLLGLAMTKDDCLANLALKGLAKDSDELSRLLPFPRDVPVRAIAGNVAVMTQFLFESMTTGTGSDMVVGVDSATSEYTSKGVGDGRFEFRCFTRMRFTALGSWQKALDFEIRLGECWHNAMTQTGYIQESVTNGIREYLASLDRPTGKLVKTFNGLTLHLPDSMELNAYHGEGPSSYELECESSGAACPALSVYNPREVGGDLGWHDWGWQDQCGANVPIRGGVLPIGGHPARAYTAGHCRFWELNDGSALIFTTSPPGTKQAKAVDDIVGSARWN